MTVVVQVGSCYSLFLVIIQVGSGYSPFSVAGILGPVLICNSIRHPVQFCKLLENARIIRNLLKLNTV